MSRPFSLVCRTATVAGLLVAVLLVGSPTPQLEGAQPAAETPPAARTFVGTPSGAADSARIGIVCDEKNFLVYVCSQDVSFNADHAAWFRGTREGEKINATNGNRTLRATVTADKVTGEITSGGMTFSFTAKNCDGHVVAGLYRAEDTDEGTTFVFGWVVDEDGNVAGGLQRQGVKGTRVVPNNGILNGVNGQVNPKAQPVNGQRVQNPANPPAGAKKKFTPARRQEFLNRVVAKTPQGGNPLMAGLIHMIKRFNAGARPEGEIEQAVFAKLRTVPRQALNDYIKNWEELPVNIRERMVGTDLKGLDLKQPLTPARAKALADKSGVVARKAVPAQPGSSSPKISQVLVKQLKCNQTTSSAGEGRDEIFAVYAVSAGASLSAKSTSIISGIRKADQNTFAAADQIVFPPAEQPGLTSSEDVFVVAKLFESDGNVALIKNLVKVLVDSALVTVAILTAPAGAGVAGFIAPANILIDQVAAGIPDAQPLGEDTFRATVSGRIRNIEDSANKNELKYERTDRAGPAPFDYRLRGLDVKN